MDLWAYKRECIWISSGHASRVENGYVESFSGKLRDECLNVES